MGFNSGFKGLNPFDHFTFRNTTSMKCVALLLSIKQVVGSTDGLVYKHHPGFLVILTRIPSLLDKHQNSTVQ